MFTKADKSAPSTFVARAPSTKSDAPFFSSTKDTKATSGGGQSFFAAQPSFAVQPSTAVQASLVVQPKLEVSQPSDPLEHEADAVADEVMSASAPSAVSTGDGSVQPKDDGEGNRRQGEFMARPVLQRSALSGRIQRQEGPGGFASNMGLGDDLGGVLHAKLFSPGVPGFLQRRARGPPTDDGHTSSDFEATLASSKSAGTPMPSDLRSNMEGRFGADFGAVRIHTGANAQAMNSSIHAKAFTHGGDIYFNAGQYSPATSSGQKLIAHELTHTLQQGASRPASGASSSSLGATGTTQPKTARSIQRSPVQVARAADGAQREAAVALARAEQGLVSAKDTGPDGKRMGWERLLEYFTTVFGEDRIVSGGSAAPPGAVPEDCIKRVGETTANTKGPDGKTTLYGQKRDWMPSWCGIFAFWALNKGGIPLKKWQLGENMFPREAAYPPGHQPQAGDIAWREEFSHFALVASSSGGEVTTVNGNTAGDDNVGGQIQELTHPIGHWFAFFDPASIQDGPLQSPGSGTGAVAPPVRSLDELRETLFGVNPKRDNSAPTQSPAAFPSASAAAERTTPIQNTVRNLARTAAAVAPSLGGEGGLDEEVPVEREQEAGSTSSVARAALSPASSASDGPPHTRAHGFAAANGGRGPSTPVFGVSAEPSLTLARSALPYGPPPTQQRLPQARGPPAASVMGAITKGAVQRNWLGDAFDAVADAAGEAARFVAQGLDAAKAWLLGQVRDFVAAIPGYDVLSLVLGFDPITRQERPLNGNNLLEAGLDVIPLGTLFREVLIRTGVFNDVATWLDGRLGSLRILAQDIGGRFSEFWDGLTIERCGEPGAVMEDVANLLRSTITSLVDYFGESASTFLTMIKQVMIREIAAFVEQQIPQLYPLLRVALGFDPQTLETVERNGTNILDALLMVHEDGEEQRRQMMETGTYQRIVGWVDEGIDVFSRAWVNLRAAVMGLWNRVSIERLADPLGLWEEIYASFAGPIAEVTSFMVRAGVEILGIIKDAVLSRLSAFAEDTRGYFLLKVIIGRDPFTGAVVPRTVHNLVRGFMGLMEGGEEQYQQLRESGAIDDAVARVMAAVDALG
ncbi:MAG TPA: DUF4157 domain-containing protein, partial [Polyangiaceae bacterium]|nr:DUF4157 domain-containing protein [Polyangiaceae bacterium]